MAQYQVTRSCGHIETVALFGKMKDRQWRLENVEPNKLCHECWQKEMTRQHEEENREAAEAAKEMGLPALTGTEKQIPWAESIRQRLLAGIDELIYTKLPEENRYDVLLQKAYQSIRNKTSASWWIDHRHYDSTYGYADLLEREARAVVNEAIDPPTMTKNEAAVDAMTEATVRPENPVTETPAEIRATENAVEVMFPERREDFREIVRGKLHMKWSGTCWRRELKPKNGTPRDRAAEAGHRLLAAGFVIRIFDPELREKAIAGDYEPECTRWIQKRTSGEYEGWFAIDWGRDEDFYQAAKRISGSRYSKPNIVVPPANFDEVLDFAKMYEFRISDAAMKVAEEARRIRDAALTVKVEAPTEQPKVNASGMPPKLAVPEEVEIADEFKD